MEELTKEQQDELNKLAVAMAEEAISVRLDYEENGSELDSDSLIAIHQNSPLLQNIFPPLKYQSTYVRHFLQLDQQYPSLITQTDLDLFLV